MLFIDNLLCCFSKYYGINKLNFVRNILILTFTGILLYSCQEIVSPTDSGKIQILKSETKWNIDINSNLRTNKIYYKEYNKAGNLTINEEYTENGSLHIRSSYNHEVTGSTEEVLMYGDTGNVLSKNKNEYQYDHFGRVVKKTAYDGNGKVSSVYTFQYDSKGNVVTKIEQNSTSGSQVKTDFNYSYNKQGELVERITIQEGAEQSRDSLVYFPDRHQLQIYNFGTGGRITNIVEINYNNAGRIIDETKYDITGKILKKYNYEYTFFLN